MENGIKRCSFYFRFLLVNTQSTNDNAMTPFATILAAPNNFSIFVKIFCLGQTSSTSTVTIRPVFKKLVTIVYWFDSSKYASVTLAGLGWIPNFPHLSNFLLTELKISSNVLVLKDGAIARASKLHGKLRSIFAVFSFSVTNSFKILSSFLIDRKLEIGLWRPVIPTNMLALF